MRCPSCNKFVSFDTDTEPEVSDETYHPESQTVSFEVRIVNTCAECGEELKDASFSAEIEGVTVDHKDDCTDRTEVTVEVDATRDDKVQPGKLPRYTKTFYGYAADVTVTCDACKASASVSTHDVMPASSMNELV